VRGAIKEGCAPYSIWDKQKENHGIKNNFPEKFGRINLPPIFALPKREKGV
jgi:hypothetical protein